MKKRETRLKTEAPFVDRQRAGRLVQFAAVLGAMALFAGSAYHTLLLALTVSVFLTYLLLPLVDFLERRKVPRGIAVATIVIGALGTMAWGLIRLLPLLYTQTLSLLQLAPKAISIVVDTWLPWTEKFVAGFGVASPEQIHQYLEQLNLISRLESQVQAGLAGLWRTASTLMGGAINLALIPVLTLFFLKDFAAIRKTAALLTPADLRAPMAMVVHRIDSTLRTVLKGQMIVAGVLGVMYVIGLSLVGLPSALAIGVVAGVCRLIPYLDVLVGGILSAIVLLSDFPGWSTVVMVIIVFTTVQGIDGALITPAVLGDRVGLHPLVVIASVLAAADWFGFWGVLLAVPVLSVIKVLLELVRPFYLNSSFYRT